MQLCSLAHAHELCTQIKHATLSRLLASSSCCSQSTTASLSVHPACLARMDGASHRRRHGARRVPSDAGRCATEGDRTGFEELAATACDISGRGRCEWSIGCCSYECSDLTSHAASRELFACYAVSAAFHSSDAAAAAACCCRFSRTSSCCRAVRTAVTGQKLRHAHFRWRSHRDISGSCR